MKTIILIGMVSLGTLNVNHAATAKQTSLDYQTINGQFLEFISNDTIAKDETSSTATDENYYFNPSSVLPVSKKTLEQEIKENNLIVESDLTTEISFNTPSSKTIGLVIYEDAQITEVSDLGVYQPLDFDTINCSTKSNIDVQNKCSLKVENIKL